VSYALAAGQEVETLSTASHSGTTGMNLFGNDFAQTIFGNFGNNTIEGKGGNDVLHGFAGFDTFVFTGALGAGNVDTIADYSVADDTIVLDDATFTGLALGTLSANAFVTGTQAQDADDRIIYDPTTGALYFDADGNGSGAAVQFASVSTGLAMTNSEFVVI
jgi:serralysin